MARFRLAEKEATPEEFNAALDRAAERCNSLRGMDPFVRGYVQSMIDGAFQVLDEALHVLDDWRIDTLTGTDADRINGFVAASVEADARLALLACALQGMGFCPRHENGKEWNNDD